jgi:hypothetical protein
MARQKTKWTFVPSNAIRAGKTAGGVLAYILNGIPKEDVELPNYERAAKSAGYGKWDPFNTEATREAERLGTIDLEYDEKTDSYK